MECTHGEYLGWGHPGVPSWVERGSIRAGSIEFKRLSNLAVVKYDTITASDSDICRLLDCLNMFLRAIDWCLGFKNKIIVLCDGQ